MKGLFLCYKGVVAFAQYHEKDGVFHGKIEEVNDLITFGGEAKEDVIDDFRNAVDDMLEEQKECPANIVSTLEFTTT